MILKMMLVILETTLALKIPRLGRFKTKMTTERKMVNLGHIVTSGYSRRKEWVSGGARLTWTKLLLQNFNVEQRGWCTRCFQDAASTTVRGGEKASFSPSMGPHWMPLAGHHGDGCSYFKIKMSRKHIFQKLAKFFKTTDFPECQHQHKKVQISQSLNKVLD